MKSFPLLLASFIFSCTLFAQDLSNITHTIDSKFFGKERKVYVFLPERYLNSEIDTFAVTYVLDAQYKQLWDMAKYNLEYLVDNRQIIPMIAVGIHTENRGIEFIPPRKNADPDDEYNNGIAHLLQQHLKEEVIPLIEKNYRVTSLRTLIGHSRGGAFVANTLFGEYSDLFRAYVGISPAMGYLDNQILHQAGDVLKSGKRLGKFYYCTLGDVGEREFYFGQDVAHIDSLVQKYPNPTLTWEWQVFEGTDHWTCVIPSFNYALMKMSRHFWIDQKRVEDIVANKSVSVKDQIDAFYKKTNQNFGYSIIPDIGSIKYFADQLTEENLFEEAVEIYKWANRVDPTYVSTHRNLAWAYKELGKPKKALASYQKAMENLELKKDQLDAETYEGMKKAIAKKIDELK